MTYISRSSRRRDSRRGVRKLAENGSESAASTSDETAATPSDGAPQITSIYGEVSEYKGTFKDKWEIIYNAVMIEFRRTIKNIWVAILIVLTWLSGVIPGILYVIISLLISDGSNEEIFDPKDFMDFYSFIYLYLVLFCGYIPAKNVTAQKADRTITLYLCRPISKLDYLIIKFLVMVLTLTVVIILPNIILFFLVVGILRNSFVWTLSQLWVLGSIVLYGLIVISVFSLMSLAMASSTKKMHWAVAGIFTFLYLSTGLAFVMRLILENDYVILISPWDNLLQVGAPLFDSSVPYSIPWPLSFGMLVVYVALSLGILMYNINRVEVIE